MDSVSLYQGARAYWIPIDQSDGSAPLSPRDGDIVHVAPDGKIAVTPKYDLSCYESGRHNSFEQLSDPRGRVSDATGEYVFHGPLCASDHGETCNEIWLQYNEPNMEESPECHKIERYQTDTERETSLRKVFDGNLEEIGKEKGALLETFKAFFRLLPFVSTEESLLKIKELAEKVHHPYPNAELTIAVGLIWLGIHMENQDLAEKAFLGARAIFIADHEAQEPMFRTSAHLAHLYRHTGNTDAEIEMLLYLINHCHNDDDRFTPLIQRLIELDPDHEKIASYLDTTIERPVKMYHAIAVGYQIAKSHDGNPLNLNHPTETSIRLLMMNQFQAQNNPEVLDHFVRLFELDQKCEWIKHLQRENIKDYTTHVTELLFTPENALLCHTVILKLLEHAGPDPKTLNLLLKYANATNDIEKIIDAHRQRVTYYPHVEVVEDTGEEEIFYDSPSPYTVEGRGKIQRQYMKAFLKYCNESNKPLHEHALNVLSNLNPDDTKPQKSTNILLRAIEYLDDFQDGEPAIALFVKAIEQTPLFLESHTKRYDFFVRRDRTEEGVQLINGAIQGFLKPEHHQDVKNLYKFMIQNKIEIFSDNRSALELYILERVDNVKEQQVPEVERSLRNWVQPYLDRFPDTTGLLNTASRWISSWRGNNDAAATE